jgi:triphosphoribosyl-dephospho-CoA synthase
VSPDSVLASERPVPRAVVPSDLALARAAVAALYDELRAYPKPGLVSAIDSGAHADMDFALMSRSADSLLKPFASLAAAGREASSFEDVLMPLGMAAERRMLAVTGGVNTHRGAIFSLGLIVAAVARAAGAPAGLSPELVQATLMREWGDALEAHAARGAAAFSHGSVVRRKTGCDGARHEAARGFPSIFGIGVPAYSQALEAGLDGNAASIQTLFALMEAVDDTTVLYRGGLGAGLFVRRSAVAFLSRGGCAREGWFEEAERLHRAFVARNISPGGCADLLAVTRFVVRCCREEDLR